MTERNWRDKLPAWKLEAIEAELLHGALSWPTEAEPKRLPFFWGDYDRAFGEGHTPGTYWTINVAAQHVTKVVVAETDKPDWRGKKYTFNGKENVERGHLYASEREAWLAVLWGVCRDFANKLQRIKSNIGEAQ